MNPIKNRRLTSLSRSLRLNMTPEERKLWYCFLKALPFTFHRQKVIGSYIADFYCAKAHLIIELDGSQHYEPEAQHYDAERNAYFLKLGITTLRFTNRDVNKCFRAVCEEIYRHLPISE